MAVTHYRDCSNSIELSISYYQNPSIQLRNQLVMLHAGLVRKLARQFSRQCTEPYEDLEQIGYFGLIRAIEQFNPDRGYAFSSFATPYIRGEILHFLRDRTGAIKIPRRKQELHNQGQKIRRELTLSLDRCPTDAEIARQLQVSLQEWLDSRLAFQNRLVLSFESTIYHLGHQIKLADTLPDRRSIALHLQQEEQQQLQGAMNQLEEKTRKAVEFVFLKGCSRKEAARHIGISPMTVTRYLQKGKEQLFAILRSQIV